MSLAGKFFSPRDMNFIHSINGEFMSDWVETMVDLFKICPEQTQTNIYGETSAATGKVFFPGVTISSLIDREDITTDDSDFGPNRKQDVAFMFREKMLQEINFFPEVGDIILFNSRYHEIDNVVQEQFIGGQHDKSLSIICNTHYSTLSNLNIVNRQF